MTQQSTEQLPVMPLAPVLRERGIAIIRESLSFGVRADNEVEVYRSLAALAGEAQANPVVARLDTIATRSGVPQSRLRALMRHLEQIGLIEVIHRGTDGHVLPNAWKLLRPSRRRAGVQNATRERDADQLALAV